MPVHPQDISTVSLLFLLLCLYSPRSPVNQTGSWPCCNVYWQSLDKVAGVLLFSVMVDNIVHINYQRLLSILKESEVSNVFFFQCTRGTGNSQYISMQFVHLVQSLHSIPSLWQSPQLWCQSFVNQLSSRLEWDFLIGKHRRRDLVTNDRGHFWFFPL